MYRIDLSECPDILELGLMAAADPDLIEKAVASLVGGCVHDLKPGEGDGAAALQSGSPLDLVQNRRRARG
ncbi:MAG: hypothetical protein KAH44_06650 [Oricola sp.]|jgi:hypothetical protein|nr:hypothetical protein [Oricola sp.]